METGDADGVYLTWDGGMFSFFFLAFYGNGSGWVGCLCDGDGVFQELEEIPLLRPLMGAHL